MSMDGLNLEHSHVTVLLHGIYYKSVPSTCNHFNFCTHNNYYSKIAQSKEWIPIGYYRKYKRKRFMACDVYTMACDMYTMACDVYTMFYGEN